MNHYANQPAPMSPVAMAPVADYGYCGGYPYAGVAGVGTNNTFVLVVVLFILLIIIGCSCGNW
jgi:uncharacterized protein (TIGR01732 family)